MSDDLQLYLDTQTSLPKEAKADVWDAFNSSTDQADFQGRFDKLSVPKAVKADLWDMKWNNKNPLLMRQTGSILGHQPHIQVPSTEQRQQAFTQGYMPARMQAQANAQQEAEQSQRDAQAWKEKTEAWEYQARYGLEFAPPTPSEIQRAGEEGYKPVAQGARSAVSATPGLFSLDPRTNMAAREQLYGGLHNMFRGAMTFAEPVMYATAGANPLGAVEALAGAEAGGYVGNKAAQVLGASPAAQDLSGDVGTLIGGSVGFVRGGTRLAREGFDYLRGRNYAESLRSTGLPESEVLTRTATPPWEQQRVQAPTPPTMFPPTTQIDKLPEQAPRQVDATRGVPYAQQDFASAADKGLEVQSTKPTPSTPSWQDIVDTSHGYLAEDHPVEKMVEEHGDVGLLVRYHNTEGPTIDPRNAGAGRELVLASDFARWQKNAANGDRAAEKWLDSIRDVSVRDDRFSSKAETPLERVDRVLRITDPKEMQALGLNAPEPARSLVERTADMALSDYDTAFLKQMDAAFAKPEAPKEVLPSDLVGSPSNPKPLEPESDLEAARRGAPSAPLPEQRVQNMVPPDQRASERIVRDALGRDAERLTSRQSSKEDLESGRTPPNQAPPPSQPHQPNERTSESTQATPPNQTPGLSNEAKKSLLMAQQLERLARKQGIHEAILPLRAAIKARNLPKTEDALYLYTKALRTYIKGIKAGDPYALKNALDIANMKGGPDAMQMRLLPIDTIQKLWNWGVRSFQADPLVDKMNGQLDVLAKDFLNSSKQSLDLINPHFNKALTLDGWSFGSPENGLTVNVTYRGPGIKTRVGNVQVDAHPTMSVPLGVAMEPALLHDFTAEFLKNFGMDFPRANDLAGPKYKAAAAGGSSYMGLSFLPTDVLEAGLKGVRTGAKAILNQARARGLISPEVELSPAEKAKITLRQNIGALMRDKEQLYDKFKHPEVNPKSLPIGTRAWEAAKAKMLSHLGARSLLETATSRWDAATPAQFKAFTTAMETGDLSSMSPADANISKQLRTMLDQRWAQVEAINPNAADTWIENYFPHIWDNPEKATTFAQQVLGQRRPLQGPRSFLKPRYYGTIEEGMDAGLTPLTYNPIKMSLIRLHEMDRYVMAHQIKDSLATQGLAEFKRPGEYPGPDRVKLNDRIFDAYVRGEDGVLNYHGSWYAPKDVAKVVNNYLSPGLRNSTIMGFKAYDTVRAYGNILNQAQLGLSPFHIYFTASDSMSSSFAHGMELLEQGQVGRGAAKLLRTPAAPIENFIRGNRLMAEYLSPGRYPQYAQLANSLARANGRIAIDPFYKNGTIDAFWKAFHKGVAEFKDANLKEGFKSSASAAAKLPFAGVELMAKPVMEYLVPRMKLGVFADMAARLHERLANGEIQPDQFRKSLNDAWDSVDNRMGQLVYDNLHWNRMVKDMLMLTIRSVGWNVGTFRELGGAVKDTAVMATKIAAGEKAEITRRMNYALGFGVTTALVGGIVNYIYTGKAPKGVDYYAPQTGRLDESGKPERVMFPGYQRDVLSFQHAPAQTVVNKLHPWIQQINELYKNEDFWGREIVHSDDPFLKRSEQVAKYVVGNFKPLSSQAYTERRKLGASATEAALTYGAILPAPKHIGQTQGEQYFFDIARHHMERGPKSTADWESMQRIRDLRNRASQDMRQSGNSMPSEKIMNDIMEQVSKGQMSSHAANNLIKQARYTPLQRYVEHSTLDEAIEGWQRLQPAEKASVAELILRKANSVNNAPPERQHYLMEQLTRIANEYPHIMSQLATESGQDVTKPDE